MDSSARTRQLPHFLFNRSKHAGPVQGCCIEQQQQQQHWSERVDLLCLASWKTLLLQQKQEKDQRKSCTHKHTRSRLPFSPTAWLARFLFASDSFIVDGASKSRASDPTKPGAGFYGKRPIEKTGCFFFFSIRKKKKVSLSLNKLLHMFVAAWKPERKTAMNTR